VHALNECIETQYGHGNTGFAALSPAVIHIAIFPWPQHEHLPIANAPMQDPRRPLPRKTQCSAIHERARNTADLPPILADIVAV
jgi:hypothetical protein